MTAWLCGAQLGRELTSGYQLDDQDESACAEREKRCVGGGRCA